MGFKKWFISFALQGASISLFNIVISLYVVLALHGNVQNASIAVALFSFGNLLGSISASIVLDRVKRVSILIYTSFFVASFIMVLMVFVKSIYIYYLLSVLLGNVISFTGPAMTLHLSKIEDEGFVRRQINNLNLFNSIGSTLGMLFGSFILTLIKNLNDIFKLKMIFFISSILLLTSSVLTIERGTLKVSVSPHLRATKILFLKVVNFANEFFKVVDIRNLPKNMRLITASVFMAFFGANLVFSVFTVFLKEAFRVSSQFIFLLYSANSFAGNIAFFLTGRLLMTKYDRLFIRVVLFLRGILFILIGVFVVFKLDFMRAFIYASFVFFGFTWPFFYIPLTLEITNLAPHKERGKALGIFNMSINFAVILASFVAGFIALHLGYFATFIIGGTLLILGERLFTKTFS
ncbi:MFS transporter [Caldisericum exile]|uniref:Major facilitator superfamily protein n=1 Tax=Caldisericum exile (strain DSM 21853 / NBRC 104410 / AZM16c01) TaxID=511051 RepID=A0A7U6GFH2_CALEA|nr:MFS transporter [Caldisericum exile]BAL81421.1 major facilitator superfamily protein [Caldisericum exile AZM16c01]